MSRREPGAPAGAPPSASARRRAYLEHLKIITISIMAPTLVVSIFSTKVKIPLATNASAFWMILMSMGFVPIALFMAAWKPISR